MNSTKPAALPMTFAAEEREDFSTWLLRVGPRLNYLGEVVGAPSRTIEQKELQEDLVAHLDALLENLSDVKLECHEHLIRAKEYYQDWIAGATEQEIQLGWTESYKTAQDFVVKRGCKQRRIHDRLEALCNTIEFRVTTSQSMLRSLKP